MADYTFGPYPMTVPEFCKKNSLNAKSFRSKYRDNTPAEMHAGQGNEYKVVDEQGERFLLAIAAKTGGNRKALIIKAPKA